MSKKLFYLIFLIAFQFVVNAQVSSGVLKNGQASLVGISENRLLLIDGIIQEYINKEYIPGGVFIITRNNQIIYHKAFGNKSSANDKYATNDIFRICSMTKAVTTVAIMQLYEQGKIGLDDAVSDYIPAFKKTAVLNTFNEADSTYTTIPVKSPITIRQLLTHTSGITYGDFSKGKINAVYAKNKMVGVGLSHSTWTTKEFIDRLAEVPLVFQPGERFLYGLNMDVLGRIVEVVSGENLNQYFKRHIFEPLGMNDTYFYLPLEKQNRLVPIYGYNENNKFIKLEGDNLIKHLDYPKNADIGHYAGGGGLSSTALDYALFIQALLNGGTYNGKHILGRKTIDLMTSDQMIKLNKEGKGISNQPGQTHCLGFGLTAADGNWKSSKSVGTYEWGGYYTTKFFIDPKEKLGFVGMMQIHGFKHNDFWDRLTAIIYSSIVN